MKVIGYAQGSTAEQASGGISLFVGPNTVEVAGKTLPSAWPSVREMAGVVTLTCIPSPCFAPEIGRFLDFRATTASA